MYACARLCVYKLYKCICEGQRPTLDVSLPPPLETRSLVAYICVPQASCVVGSRGCRYHCLSCALRTTGITDMPYGISINTGLRDSNSESQTCTARALLTDLPPNLSKPKLFSVLTITNIKHLFLLTTH